MVDEKKSGKSKASPKQAVHDRNPCNDGAHLVGIGNLRVMLFNDDGSWFAQGLEVDYFAQGSSLDEAKKHFENGLCATLGEHLRVYGSIERMLRVAPQEAWDEFYKPKHSTYTHVSMHLPQLALIFSGISYLEATGD